MAAVREAWANFRDESFMMQYPGPHLMRKLKLFSVHDDAEDPYLLVDHTHNERGYRSIRKSLARDYDLGFLEPDIQILDVDPAGDRKLIPHHRVTNGVLLDECGAKAVLRHIANLWGYEVQLVEVSSVSEAILKEHAVTAPSGVAG